MRSVVMVEIDHADGRVGRPRVGVGRQCRSW